MFTVFKKYIIKSFNVKGQLKNMNYIPPLAVSFVWNGTDEKSVNNILDVISNQLSRSVDNPFSRGLDVPIFFYRSESEETVPLSTPTNKAEKNLIIAFTSINTASSLDWKKYLKNIQSQPDFKLIGVSIDKVGLNHATELNGFNFIRAFDWTDENKALHVTLSVLHEIYRLGYSLPDSKALGQDSSIKIFLSHAKVGKTGIQHAEAIKLYIDKTNLTNFFDASTISPGFDFGKEIEGHITNSTLLAILTDTYTSRFWCQKEIIHAKSLDRPIVILNSLELYEDRSFPELTNAPVVHVHSTPLTDESILITLIACLVETIRQNYVINNLLCYQRGGLIDKHAQILSRPLEYRKAILNIDKGITKYCYPEPPVYRDESSWHEILGVSASTPLWQEDQLKTLLSMKIGISISEFSTLDNNDYEQNLPSNTLTKLSQELARHLFSRSSTLIYGGDLRPDGFTEFILNEAAALKYQNQELSAVVENHLAWPLHLLDKDKIKEWRANNFEIIKTVKHQPPEDIEITFPRDKPLQPSTPENNYIWSRCLTEMRNLSIDSSHVRICAGGKRSKYKGAMPGVLEEIILSLSKNKPIFLIGGFGGIVHDVCKLLLETSIEEPLTEKWQLEQNENYGELQEYANKFDKRVMYDEIVNTISATSVNKLAVASGLRVEEYKQLMTTQFIDEAIYLCLKGLKQIKNKYDHN
ncbi:hypothetical protein MT391_17750 [Vibrio sp. 1-Bac 57]